MNEKEIEKIKNKIKTIAKREIWASELFRELIRENITITWPNFLKILKDMEANGEIKTREIGNMKFIEVSK